jgi:hypothetical protein
VLYSQLLVVFSLLLVFHNVIKGVEVVLHLCGVGAGVCVVEGVGGGWVAEVGCESGLGEGCLG